MAFQVHGQNRIPVRFFHLEDGAISQNAGVVNQDIHAAEGVDSGLDQTFAAGDIGHRVGIGYGFAARRLNLGYNVIGDHG